MRLPVALLAAGVLLIPFALTHGGHNGATTAGVTVTILAIVLTIATSPTKDKP